MARKQKTRKTRKTRRFGRKRNKKYSMNKTISRYLDTRYPLPPIYFNKMRWSGLCNVPATPSIGAYDMVFSQNNIAEPFIIDTAGVSTAFMDGFSESVAAFAKLDSVYDQWTVYGSKITVRCVSQGSTANTGGGMIFVRPSENPAAQTYANCTDRVADSRSKRSLLCYGANKEVVIKNFQSSKDAFGPMFKTDREYSGNSTTPPGIQRYWHVTVIGNNVISSADIPGLILQFDIEYFVRWSNLDAFVTTQN